MESQSIHEIESVESNGLLFEPVVALPNELQDNVKVSNFANSLAQDFKGFNPVGFNLGESNVNMLNVIGQDMEDFTTWNILRAHLRRVSIIFLFSIYGILNSIYWSIKDILSTFIAILYVEWYDSSWYSVMFIVYNAMYRYFQLEILNFSPTKYQDAFPQKVKPSSIGVIFDIEKFNIKPPNEIPQPYLGSDKKIHVPAKRDIQVALSLKNEYLTKERIHIAAEQIRVLNEITKFVLWSCLLKVDYITIYERTGILWSTSLEEIHNSISVELSTFSPSPISINSISKFPKIILIDCFTLERFDISSINSESMDHSKELIIYISDERLRVQPFNFKKIIEDERFSNIRFPPNPDILSFANTHNQILPCNTKGFLTCGGPESFYFASKLRFGFRFFTKSLYFYVRQVDLKLSLFEQSDTSSLSTSNYLNAFWRRFNNLRFFDLNSSKETVETTDPILCHEAEYQNKN
ncbi:hypothetical protein CAAN3_15S02850 [[Candida] anglica]